jgi:D-arabinose 1-dehydrogenase-like Zn-dependent alcohol dehydrogenase
MTDSNTFTAWTSIGKDKPLVEMKHTLRPWDEDSVEIQITHCGICGSDIHTIGNQPHSILSKESGDISHLF